MRPLSCEEDTSIPAPKPTKDKKRKMTSTSEDSEPKKKKARNSRKNIILLTEDSIRRLREEDEEGEEEDSGMVARVGMGTETPKVTESVKAAETPSRDEGVSGRDLGEIPESSRIEDASHHNDLTNGVEDATGLSDLEVSKKDLGGASSLFNEAQQALNQVKSEAEKATVEADVIVAVYRADAEAAQIIKAREHEVDAEELASDDDDDDTESKSESERGGRRGDLDGEEAPPEVN
nr:uncharacterized protein LOC104101523 [Nicotiana tomentosiformis]